ncbi:hypothetical protein IP70_19925 [alpha proteobacterium AAP38]|nr:hypothetical protein IP70_19925 [alpha proteobacterium AAP38]
MTADWTDNENDATVADYFAMLDADIAGRPYSKAEHNRRLQAVIGRRRGAIEFKHQNISAILMGLGKPWIPGYKPASNYQMSLEPAVLLWLERHPGWLAPAAPDLTVEFQSVPVSENELLQFLPSPTHSNAPPLPEIGRMAAIARKYDVAGRDARNRDLGKAGEQRVLAHERAALLSAGRTDLVNGIRWVSHLDGDGAGYDIRSFDADGRDRLIEVKTTNGWERTPFHVTRNELAVADERRDEWCLVRLWNFAREPKAFELRPPLEAHVSLLATSFQASFL